MTTASTEQISLPGKKHERNPALDVLRAIAIFLVLGRHFQDVPANEPKWIYGLFALWRQAGWCGVDLFFVLSGFLIGGLLFKEHQRFGEISIRRFYLRRGLKIYPPFYAMIAVSILGALISGVTLSTSAIVAEVLFVQSYFRGLWAHTWSLAVEEHFYILLPMVLILLARWSRRPAAPFRAIVPLWLIVAAGALALRVLNSNARPYHHLTHLFPTHLRIDSLLAGVVLAYFTHYHQEIFIRLFRPWRYPLVVLGIALFIPTLIFPLEHPLTHTIGFTFCATGSVAILAGVLLVDIPRSLGVRALAFIGAHSYSIYLWHLGVMFGLYRYLGQSVDFLSLSALYIVASVVLGIVLARAVEAPVLVLRDRWFPSRSAA